MRRLKITRVNVGSPAEFIGLRPEDVLDTLGGVELTFQDTLSKALASAAGRPNELFYYRDGERLSATVTTPSLGVAVVDIDISQLHAAWEDRTRPRSMKATTAHSLEGYVVTETLDVISSECVLGMNIFKDFFTAVSDVVGGRSGTAQKALAEGRRECLLGLRQEAAGLGADAIIAVTFHYSELTGGGKSMLLVAATGTAVKVKKNIEVVQI